MLADTKLEIFELTREHPANLKGVRKITLLESNV